MKEMPRWHTGRPGTRHPHPGGAVLLQPCALVLTRAKFMPSLMEEETSHGLLETGPMPQRVLKLAHSDPKLPVPSIQPALPPKARPVKGDMCHRVAQDRSKIATPVLPSVTE